MSTIVTQVTTEEQPLYLTLRITPQRAPSPVRNISGGTLENRSRVPVPVGIPISQERDSSVMRRIQLIKAWGKQAQIKEVRILLQGLLKELNETSLLSPGIKSEIAQWSETFFSIDEDDQKTRADTIAILLLKVIQPILLGAVNANAELKNQALAWEEACHKILKGILPQLDSPDAIAAFIHKCGILFQKAHIFLAKYERKNVVSMALTRSLNDVSDTVHQGIDHGFNSSKEQLVDLQKTTEAMQMESDNKMEAISDKVNQLRQVTTTNLATISTINAEVTSKEAAHQQNLATCKNMIMRLT